MFKLCETCGRHKLWFRVKKRRMGSAYQDDEKNFVVCCPGCFVKWGEYWDAMWEDAAPSPLG